MSAQAIGLAVIAGADGSPAWRVARVLGVLAVTAAAVVVTRGRSRLGAAVAAFVAGITGCVVGLGIGLMHVTHAVLDVYAVSGLVCLLTGLWLFARGLTGIVRCWRGWRRLLAVPLFLFVAAFALYPLPAALYATNVPRPSVGEQTPADLGFSFVDARFPTRDGVILSGWYIPSRNGGAVVVAHGASSTRSAVLRHAAVLARHGYGVLLYDARGHGRSGGRAMEFGWYGDEDVSAAVSYVHERPDVDPSRIGALGLSMGGEQVVGAAASDERIRAVVGEGVTGRTRSDKAWLPTHWRGWLQRGMDAVLYGATDLLTDAEPPASLRSSVARAAPRPVLLIAGGAVMANAEEDADRWIQGGSPDTVQLWVVPRASHTAGLAKRPAEWAQRVTGFLDAALL